MATQTRKTRKPVATPVDDTPLTPHDCEMDELEATRYEGGIDEAGTLGRW